MTDPPTSIRLPRELKKYLKQVADAQRQRLTPLVIWILDNWVKEQKKGKEQ